MQLIKVKMRRPCCIPFLNILKKKLTFSIGRFVCLPTLPPISYISICTTLQKKVVLFQYNENIVDYQFFLELLSTIFLFCIWKCIIYIYLSMYLTAVTAVCIYLVFANAIHQISFPLSGLMPFLIMCHQTSASIFSGYKR